MDITFQQGFSDSQLDTAVSLYDIAFGAKLGVAIRSDVKRQAFLCKSLLPNYAISAMDGEKLVGLAGFHTAAGSLTGGFPSGMAGYRQFISQLGFLRGHWAMLILALYERKAAEGQLLMDGISVDPTYRGQGIGGRLLEEIVRYATENGYNSVRLDVIDTNPRAQKLYERKGFKTVKVEKYGFLRPLLGFGGSTTMELNTSL